MFLQGPSGTELYLESLVNALGKEFEALIFSIDLNVVETLSTKPEETLPDMSSFEERRLPMRRPGLPPQPLRTLALPKPSNRKFKEGDLVKFIGPNKEAPPTATQGGALTQSSAVLSEDSIPIGSKGKIVMSFEDNPKRVGVAFESVIAGGTNLGGGCAPGHGKFVDVTLLKRESGGPGTGIELLLYVLSIVCGEEVLLNIFEVNDTTAASLFESVTN